MRVISGKARGMRLICPAGTHVRPVPDMAREALFDTLRDQIQGATILDLFSGAGTIGIEALSRGADWCVFVEQSPAVRRFLQKNLAHTRLDDACNVLQRNALTCLPALQNLGRRYDLVFAGPPFPLLLDPAKRDKLMKTLGALARTGLLNSGGHVILQHEKRSAVARAPAGLVPARRRAYGRNLFSFYVRDDST